jgi:hypothetical protein
MQEFEREKNSSDIYRVNVNYGELKKEDEPDTTSKSEDLDAFMKKPDSDLVEILEPFLDNVFSEPPNFDEIPVRPEDEIIELKPRAFLKPTPLRRLSSIEHDALVAKLKDLFNRGFIRVSSSQYGANILFARKKDGSLRNKTHAEMRERVKGSGYLSTVDIKDAFHMVRIHPDDCHKTAFQTRFGLYEYTVSPFGLSNSPSFFMKVIG